MRGLAILLLVVTPMLAQSQKARPAEKRPAGATATKEVLTAIGAAYGLCPMRIQLVALNMNLARLKGEEPDAKNVVQSMYACPDSASSVVDSLFARARKDRLSPEASGMLKDIYAEWRANVKTMLPSPFGEILEDDGERYKARMGGMAHEFERKRERLNLELP